MFLDPRWDLKPTGIAEEFDRACELWARGIPHSEVTKVGSGNNIRGSDARYYFVPISLQSTLFYTISFESMLGVHSTLNPWPA